MTKEERYKLFEKVIGTLNYFGFAEDHARIIDLDGSFTKKDLLQIAELMEDEDG